MRQKSSSLTILGSIIVCLGLVVVFLTSASAASQSTVDLSVTIVAPQHVAPGETYVANLAYTNLGDEASPDDTTLTLLLPEGVEFVSALDQQGLDLPPASVVDGLVTWTLGAVPAGECWVHVFATLAVADDLAEGDELVLQAQIASSLAEEDETNNTASVTSVVCDMAASTKQVHAGEVKPGDILTYTIQLRLALRQGNTAQMRSVTLTDTLPAGHQVRFLGWVGENAGTEEGGQLKWQGMVQAGEPFMLQYRLGVEGDVPPGTVITNTAELGYGGMRLRLGPTASEVNLPPHAVMAGPLGHTWQVQEGLTVEIPPNAVQEMTRFEYQLMNGEAPDETPAGHVYAHRYFELNAYRFGEQHEFGEALQLKLKLKPEEIAGLNKQTLRLWHRAGPGEPWQMMGEPEWLSEDTVSFTTDHFTQFALFGTGMYQVYLPVARR